MARKRPPTGNDQESFNKRIEWLNALSGLNLDPEKRWMSEDLEGIIENPFGYVKVPIALCGPLEIQGDYAKGEFVLPFATVEGTLSMSLNRGSQLCNFAGGVKTSYLGQEISRTPLFFLESIEKGKPFIRWIKENFLLLKEIAESTTNYGKLVRIDPYQIGGKVFLDFIYTTGDAAGQNIVTIATQAACFFIQEKLQEVNPVTFIIEGNFSGDKKACARNILKGRGHSATASVRFSEELIRRVLKLDLKRLVDGAHVGQLGSVFSGQMGHNLHTANALTGFYLATGQDVACVAENSGSIFEAEITDDGGYECSMTLPSLTIGTVGGGTRLEDQKTNLKILGCLGENSSKKLAEIIAAAALALEFSLGVAIVKNEFSDAHQKYGRRNS